MCPSSEEEKMEMSLVLYTSTLGKLVFAITCKRSDITHAMGVISWYMVNPGVKRILKYVNRTLDVALYYGRSNFIVNGYVNINYVGDSDKSKSSTPEYVFPLIGEAMSWVSKL